MRWPVVSESLVHRGRGMSKTYRDWSPDQPSIFPPSPRDWLPEDDLVYFLLDTVASFDLAPFFAYYERETRGQPPFHPRMMVSILLYCYATGTRSSRKIMRRCQVDVACRIIVGEDIPGFRTISDFRKTHLDRLEALFVEVLKLCALAGLAEVMRSPGLAAGVASRTLGKRLPSPPSVAAEMLRGDPLRPALAGQAQHRPE